MLCYFGFVGVATFAKLRKYLSDSYSIELGTRVYSDIIWMLCAIDAELNVLGFRSRSSMAPDSL